MGRRRRGPLRRRRLRGRAVRPRRSTCIGSAFVGYSSSFVTPWYPHAPRHLAALVASARPRLARASPLCASRRVLCVPVALPPSPASFFWPFVLGGKPLLPSHQSIAGASGSTARSRRRRPRSRGSRSRCRDPTQQPHPGPRGGGGGGRRRRTQHTRHRPRRYPPSGRDDRPLLSSRDDASRTSRAPHGAARARTERDHAPGARRPIRSDLNP